MKEKSEVNSKLVEAIAEARTSGITVKELQNDNGPEFDNEKVRKILCNMGSSRGWSLHTLHNKMDMLREITELSLKL